jgi:hypothetical protein
VKRYVYETVWRVYRLTLKNLLPIKVKTFIRAFHDVKLKKGSDGYGGPFTGQLRRQEIFREIMRAIPFKAIVETGTYRGETTAFFAQFGVPVFTVESQLYDHYVSSLRLRSQKNVHPSFGDSREFLRQLQIKPEFPREHVLFYLDAHWFEQLPLAEEFDIIRSHWTDSVIIIDDFKVPGDDGYGYDDYGPGKVICLDYLENHGLAEFQTFFPAVSSAEETGWKRGCAVFVNGNDLVSKMETLNGLRKFCTSAEPTFDVSCNPTYQAPVMVAQNTNVEQSDGRI